ncbi:MAG: DegT/DnrJ/EryC1/StrS family aminotransferase [Planctomycetaceae bacterium]|nr:DegT/DnrJ/EryC1/StrS family aminotransferase [Planctomycetaceae bacterium]
MNHPFSRRDFMAATGGLGMATVMSGLAPMILSASDASADGKPAILGGTPYNQGAYTHWPVIEDGTEEKLLEVFRTGNWFRGYSNSGVVSQFEQEFAAMNKSKHCLAVSSGTGALITSMAAYDIGPGDEVITSPYTFIATINSILSHFALPVPVDVDLETFQLSAAAAEKAISSNTRCLMPVHIGGAPADMDAFVAIGKRRDLPVIEDACQAHFGRWRDKSIGSVGTAGCFSMQVSKNLCSGEGGAILTDDDTLAEKLHKCHNNCRGRTTDSFDFTYGVLRGVNYRMAGLQAAILLGQMKAVEKNADIRQENGVYLNNLLAEIPGVFPAKPYPGVTRGAWHLYMFRIDRERFGLDRGKFISALNAERIPCSQGYGPVDWVDFARKTFATKAGERIYPKKTFDDITERIGSLPNFKRLCSEGVWFTQNMLLGPKSNMDIIADAIRRIQKNAADIAKA